MMFLQTLEALQDLLYAAGDLIVTLAEDLGGHDAARRSQGSTAG